MNLFVFLLKILILITIFSAVESFNLLKSKKKPSSFNKKDTKQTENKNTVTNNNKQQYATKNKPMPKSSSSISNNNAPNANKKNSYQAELLKERDVLLKLQQQVSNNNNYNNNSLDHPAMNALRTVLQRMHSDIINSNNNNSTSENVKTLDKIPKTSFNNKLRILFVAGLEGTGHHAMKSVLKECYTKGLCLSAGEATYDLFKHDGDGDHGLFGVLEGKYSGLLLERYYRHLSELKRKGEAMLQDSKNQNTGHLFIYGLEYQPGAGMLSYPNFNDKEHKVFNHADIIPMAILSESLGFDFRVLVLQRRSYEIFASTMVKRGFGHGLEPKILLMNAAALYSQLSFLDPNFFRCLNYNEMLTFSDQQLSQVASFLHPNIDLQMMKRMWQELRSPVNTTSNTTSTSTSSSSSTSAITSNTKTSHLRRVLSSAAEAHSTSTSSSTSAVHHRTHDTTPESAEMHEMLRGYEFYILRLAMELNRFGHICPAL